MSQLNETSYPAAVERYNALKSERNAINREFENTIEHLLFGNAKPNNIKVRSIYNGIRIAVEDSGDALFDINFDKSYYEQFASLKVSLYSWSHITEKDFQDRLYWVEIEKVIYTHAQEIRNAFTTLRNALEVNEHEFYHLSNEISSYECEVREAKEKAAREEVEKTLAIGKGIAYYDSSDGKISGGLEITKITPKRIYGRNLWKSTNYKGEFYVADYGERFVEKDPYLNRISQGKYKVVDDLRKAIVQGE